MMSKLTSSTSTGCSVGQQPLANDQNRAKVATFAVEFCSTLQRLPKMKSEIDAALASNQTLDYEGLAQCIEPQLEAAAAFLNEVDFLSKDIRELEAVRDFVEQAQASLVLHTVLGAKQRLQDFCAKQRAAIKQQAIMSDGWSAQLDHDQYGRYAELTFKSVKQRFRFIPVGSFMMGSTESEPERSGKEIQHQVDIKNDFWIADTACTQALWMTVMGENPSFFKSNENNPVEQVSWNEVQVFLKKLNDCVPGWILRLPSEAEWEYACRAGTSTAFSFGNWITSNQTNYNANYDYAGGIKGEFRGETVVVKSFSANAWGMYQMHGNVNEWCEDYWDSYENAATDGSATKSGDGSRRMLRGGSWIDAPSELRSASRSFNTSDFRIGWVGFRLACSPLSIN